MSKPADKSVAVLPFENLSEEKQNEFFAIGVQDEILTDLARVADLKVISRSSVMQYKTGVPRNLREIGKILGVAYVLEGSVQRVGGKVRVTAQLIDTQTDAHVWAQRYDRELADIFAIQSEVAEAIAAQLQAKISPAERTAMNLPPTRDLKAFDLYQQALAQRDGRLGLDLGKEGLLETIRLLDAAVARDPSFRLAYVKLAEVHDLIYAAYDHSENRLALAEAAVQTAERLEPKAGETILARAIHSYWGQGDLEVAHHQLQVARESAPNVALIFYFLASIDRRQGRWDDSLANFRRALELDPLNRAIVFSTWSTNLFLRRYADAMAVLVQNPVLAAEDSTKRLLGFTQTAWTGDLRLWRAESDAADAVGTGRSGISSQWPFMLAEWERDVGAATKALGRDP